MLAFALATSANGSVTQRTERLVRVTAAIADAVAPDEVLRAVVDQVGEAIGATTAGLWVVEEDRSRARLARSYGYAPDVEQKLGLLELDRPGVLPIADTIHSGEPIWIASKEAMLERYPH